MSKTVPALQVDELVNVTIRNARVTNTYPTSRNGVDTGTVLVADYPGRGDLGFAVNLAASGVTVERVAPAEWPPRIGDVWEDRNKAKWFGTERTDGVRLTSASGDTWSDFGEVLTTVGPMRLLFRDGWTQAADTTPAETKPEQVDRRAALVASLRAGADWIEQHTELPVTGWRDSGLTYCCGSEAELERIAAQLGVPVKVEEYSGHLRVTVPVDGVTYDAFRVPERRKPAQWLAEFHPGVTILDYDGWRDEGFESEITRYEFERRLAQCTASQPVAVQPDDPAEADSEAPVPAPAELSDAQLAAAEAEDDTPPAGCRCEDCEAERNIPAPLPHRTPDPDVASLLAESLADGAA